MAASADPPGRVGRITYLEGTVSFYADREDGWRKAELNYPVTSENSLWNDGAAKSEVRFGPSAIRLNDDTVFDFVRLQDDVLQGYLQRGSIHVRSRQAGTPDAGDTLRIDTAEGRFTLEDMGRYRLDASANGGESRITVFSGRARFEGLNASDTRLTIDAGKQLTIRANGGALDFRYDTAAETAFDRWAEDRDRQWDQIHQRYAQDDARVAVISPYMTGYEDLDGYGDWVDDREYGRLWAPRIVARGWAPYRYGHWAYVRPWGWTWIDEAPWGFAPFHYGRWVQVRSRWCWWPGEYRRRPVYAPALVAWFGNGGGLTISSGPAMGWFPLAPREHYIPRYTTNATYIRNINYVTNNITVVNPPMRYRNQVPGATIVPNHVFRQGNPVGGHATPLPPKVIAGHKPIAAPDIPRPPRQPAWQPPDRQPGGSRVTPFPQPRFNGNTPPLPPATGGAQTPKVRPAEPVIGGRLPLNPNSPVPAPTPPPQRPDRPIGQGLVSPPPASTPSAPPPPITPRPRPQHVPAPPATTGQPVAPSGAATPRIEPAPAMRDRDVRPAESRPPVTRPPVRPPVETHSAPSASGAPAVVPRPPVARPPSAPPAAREPSPAKPMPAPAAAPKPHAEPKVKVETKEVKPKPGVAKD